MALAARKITIPYAPRRPQLLVHQSRRRFNVLVAHRRLGKSVMCCNELIKGAVTCKLENPRFAYIAPFFNQAKDVVWEYLKHYSAPIPGVEFNESELRADYPNKSRVRLYGADNADRLRGLYFDGVVLDEYAQMHPRIWSEIIRPALVDRGGWAIFIGTPMGKNQFHGVFEDARIGFVQPDGSRKLDPDWYAAMFKASETGIIPKPELEAAKRSMSEEQYAQEFECSFEAAIVGAYYGKLLASAEFEGRVTRVPYDPALKVTTIWDLGVDDSTAIWFMQQHRDEIRLIDYYEGSGVGLGHYAKHLETLPYVFGDHIFPPDAAVRELGTGATRVETLKGLGIKARVLGQQKIEDGIERVRTVLPRCWFDAVKCRRGLDALQQYRTEYDDKAKIFRNRPLHDWTSHAADSFRYLAMGLRAVKAAGATAKNDPAPAGPGSWMA